MNNFELRNLPDLFFGHGAEKRCGELLREMGATRILIHHSGEPFVLPLVERIKGYIQEAGLWCTDLGGVKPNPRLSLIYEGIKVCRRENIDAVLAVGGGSVIDSAKGIAMGAVYDGDVWDFYMGTVIPTKILMLGAVSTFAGTGSEFSRASIVTNEELALKRSCDDIDIMRPAFAIVDPDLTITVPPAQTASGAADIFSHCCEFYFTHTKDVYLSHKLLAAAMKTVLKNAPIAYEKPDDYAARSALAITAPLAICGILRLGLVGDWACHLIEHEMSTEFDLPHGTGLAIITPYWIEYVYRQDIPLFARWAVDAFGVEYDFDDPERTVKDGLRALRNFYRQLDLPDRIHAFAPHADEAALRRMAARIPYYGGPDKTTIGETFPLTEEDVFQIYRLTL